MSKARIFIVEDEIVVAQSIRMTLVKLGYEVAGLAASGEKALAAINQDPPDLVLMDIVLHGRLGGIETAEAIHRDHHLPVVFLTAHADADTFDRARNTGPSAYLVKPFEARELKFTLEIALTRAEMDRRLRESERRFRSAFDQAAVGFCHCGLDGVYLRVNDRFCSMLGYAREELIGKTFREVTPPEYVAAEDEADERLLAGEIDHYSLEKGYIRADGSYLWGLLTVSLVRDDAGRPEYTLGVVEDVSERKIAEAEVSGERRKFKSLFDNALETILMADDTGRYVDVNPAAEEMTGYTREQLLQMTVHDIAPRPAREDTGRLWSSFVSDGRQTGEFVIRRSDGEEVVAEYRAVTNILPGLHMSVLRDVTARKQAEDERERLIKELEEALANVETLEGLLPICSNCKKIRDDEGYWQQIEKFFQDRSGALFSHSICPDCVRRLYPELYDE